MFLTRIKISNFRNIEEMELSPQPSVNLITGPNGSGKTSILEAIFCCCTTKSFRYVSDSIMRRRDHDVCRLEINGVISGEETGVALAWSKAEKKLVKVNGVKLPRLADLLLHFHAVSFIPEDSDLVLGAPSLRRRLLNLAICQADRSYIVDLIEYHKIISQRNALLKEFCLDEDNDTHLEMLNLWDEQLSQVGGRIIGKRLELVNMNRGKLQDYYKSIAAADSQLDWRYHSSFSLEDDVEGSLLAGLRLSRRRDLHFGFTSVGPHRDDLLIDLDDVTTRGYASQGEAKSIALAIMFTIYDYLTDKLGAPPILLLDEVSAQLDADRLNSLLNILPRLGQVFLTSSRPADIKKSALIQAEMKIDQGRLVT
ncbi:MAG: DNA replication and repair protein RecF [candidate division Zixibacteria bacterium]|nr:DNA replication and repair protein RecF [candidate division Zixibacteria bacterium]